MRVSDARGDERGAIMVFGLFFCVLCIAMVYYLYGLADAIGYRERVQDAADMAAFSGAVVHANGMNLIALFNMVMAAILAILVALRLVVVLVYIAIGVIAAVGWLTGGALYAAIPPVQQLGDKVDKVADKLKEPLHKVIEAVHLLGDVVAKVTPLAASGRTIYLARKAYTPEVDAAVAIPASLTLPVEPDDFGVLCNHAGTYVGHLTMFPFAPVLPETVRDRMAGAFGKLSELGSEWFCGKEGAEPPSFTGEDTKNVPRPESIERHECMAVAEGKKEARKGDDPCLDAALFELASMPDQRGSCRMGRPLCPQSCPDEDACPPTGSDCDNEMRDDDMRKQARQPVASCDPWEWRKRQARIECAPRSEGGPRGLRGVWWLEEVVTRTWRFDGKHWQRLKEEAEEELRVQQNEADSKKHPCGTDGQVGVGYEFSGSACESEPECVSGLCDRSAPRGEGQTFVERVKVVRDLVHCVDRRNVPKEEREKQAEEADVGSEDGNNDRLTPFKVTEGVWLGDDELQVKSFAYGGGASKLPGRGVRLAAWGRKVQVPGITKVGKVLERFGLAQAEFYFRSSNPPASMDQRADMLWHMNWRARMRSLRLSSGGVCGGSGGSSGSSAGSAGGSGGGQSSLSGFSSGGLGGSGGGLSGASFSSGAGGGGGSSSQGIAGQVLGGADASACKQLDGALQTQGGGSP